MAAETGITYADVQYQMGITFGNDHPEYPSSTEVGNAVENYIERWLRGYLSLAALDTTQCYVDAVISLAVDWCELWSYRHVNPSLRMTTTMGATGATYAYATAPKLPSTDSWRLIRRCKAGPATISAVT